jgi:hypothetical protein
LIVAEFNAVPLEKAMFCETGEKLFAEYPEVSNSKAAGKLDTTLIVQDFNVCALSDTCGGVVWYLIEKLVWALSSLVSLVRFVTSADEKRTQLTNRRENVKHQELTASFRRVRHSAPFFS